MTSSPARPRRDRGLTLVIAYKLVKSAVELALAIALVVAIGAGLRGELLSFADALRRHAHAWSVDAAALIVRAASGHALWEAVVALTMDGAWTGLEGYALIRGHWWGPWLVVVATGSLMPFELVALARRFDLVRVALLAINVAIVVYLGRRALREHRARRDGA